MWWPFAALLTIAVGSLLLIYGSAAQAWFQIAEYSGVLNMAKSKSTGPLTKSLKAGTSLLIGKWPLWFTPLAGPVILAVNAAGLYSAVALIWLTRNQLDEKEKAKFNQLVRVAAPWYLLLAGSSLVLAGALIQLVLAWPQG